MIHEDLHFGSSGKVQEFVFSMLGPPSNMLRPELSESSNVSEDEGEHLCKFSSVFFGVKVRECHLFSDLEWFPFILRSLSIILNF